MSPVVYVIFLNQKKHRVNYASYASYKVVKNIEIAGM